MEENTIYNSERSERPREERVSGWKSGLGVAKDLMPWLILAVTMIYNFGVRNNTSERTAQQQIEDHIAIQEMTKNLSELGKAEAVLAAKVDMVLTSKGVRGTDEDQK